MHTLIGSGGVCVKEIFVYMAYTYKKRGWRKEKRKRKWKIWPHVWSRVRWLGEIHIEVWLDERTRGVKKGGETWEEKKPEREKWRKMKGK